jgi:hypothetical protein
MIRELFRVILSLGVAVAGLWLLPADSCAQESQDKTYPLDAGLYYTIQKGDTLWDLSEHFFDSPWIWPDLWEKNQEIPNPHWIYPGNRIRIYNREGLEKALETPRTSAPEPPVATPEKEPEPSYFHYPAIDSVGFVRKTPLASHGTVSKLMTVKELISQWDMVYVRPAGNTSFHKGDRLTIYRTLDTVRDPETDSLLGIQHYIVGIVEIAEVAQPYSTAKVIKSYRHIEDKDLLTPYKARSAMIEISDSQKPFDGKIVGVEETAVLIGDQDLVFIDKGRSDGIKIGQYYSVYHQPEFFDEKQQEKGLLPPIDVGRILVLHVEDNTATALVTATKKIIELGERLRTPPSL